MYRLMADGVIVIANVCYLWRCNIVLDIDTYDVLFMIIVRLHLSLIPMGCDVAVAMCIQFICAYISIAIYIICSTSSSLLLMFFAEI